MGAKTRRVLHVRDKKIAEIESAIHHCVVVYMFYLYFFVRFKVIKLVVMIQEPPRPEYLNRLMKSTYVKSQEAHTVTFFHGVLFAEEL